MAWRHHRRIHNVLRKHHPAAVHKAKKLFRFKYPKLFLLVAFSLLAYYLFSRPEVSEWVLSLETFSYLGIFVAGILLPFGFFAALSIGFFIATNPQNLLLAVILGGLGAMIGDLIIFKLIKFSFMDEFRELEKMKVIHKIEKIVNKRKRVLILHYSLYIFAGLVLATPLPDEIGVAMLAGLTTIKPLKLAVISFLVHSTAILLILLI
jgi:uncharacterized membrane protein YdjX (TVP38/TMEM64 family)